jgi:hypothetical protein
VMDRSKGGTLQMFARIRGEVMGRENGKTRGKVQVCLFGCDV